jgi:NTP pyrophosphatase (non-canonical NTP hydrolase)
LSVSITGLQTEYREFAAQREWESFHTPRNLVMALANEAGEIVEVQWLTPEQSLAIMTEPAAAEHVGEEVADVFAYLLRLCDVLGIDLERVTLDKIQKNSLKYPVEKARGSAAKYTDLGKAGDS